MISAFGKLNASTYVPHALHRTERDWAESNCYIDAWIEILHALGADPIACFPFVLTVDFEDDQWTFYKPSPDDLFELYGVNIQELNVWRPLVDHVSLHLLKGRLVLTESDSYFLPDTQGTDYQQNHVKTTIGIHSLDVAEKRLGYFHNGGYFELTGDDFTGTLRMGTSSERSALPLFAEFIRVDRLVVRDPADLVSRSKAILKKHLARRPKTNPVVRFQTQFIADVEQLKELGMAAFHAHAFATVRQLGSAFEFGAAYMRWLADHGDTEASEIATHLQGISSDAKSLILKTARAVSTKRAIDFHPLLASIDQHWNAAMDLLSLRYA